MSILLYVGALLLTIILLSHVSFTYNSEQAFRGVFLERGKLRIQKELWIIIIGFIPLWILIAFRDIKVGTDTSGTYLKIFNFATLNRSWEIEVRRWSEIGYFMINRIIGHFTDNYNYVIIITGTITWFLYYRYIVKNSVNPRFSILLFFLSFYYFHSFNGIRQLLANAILLQGFKYIYSRKFKNFLIIILVASLIHTMSVLMLPFYFLSKIATNRKTSIVLVLVSKVVLSAMMYNLSGFISNTKYYNLLHDNRSYVGGYWWSDIVISSAIFFVFFFIFDEKKNTNTYNNLNGWLITVSLIIAVNSNSIPIPNRFLWYANINLPVYIPQMLKSIEQKKNRAICTSLILCFYLFYFVQQWLAGTDHVQLYAFM